MFYLTRMAITLLTFVLLGSCADHGHSTHHSQHKVPLETGQAGFAAIAEVVRLLESDPDTDWSRVNINTLRAHLLDMDRLVSGAVVEERALGNGMRFHVTGQGEVLNAIQSMVPAHAKELDKMPEFNAKTEGIERGIVLIVTGSDDSAQARIKGLGFFGLMASGSHHQVHHYMMASGQGHGMAH